jgi:hypothetical protein
MKYYILSPWAETGGPEALHQLCSTLNEIGEDAFIYYYGNDYSQTHKNEFVPKYSEYNLKSSDISNFSDLDKENNVVIIPEVFPIRLIENFQNSKVVFWRLSIFTHGQELNLPIFQKVYQGCQCDTQFKILKDSKLFDKNKYFMLSDYINEIYITAENNLSNNRKNQVLYNPRKGFKYTQSIINSLSEKNIKFIPITGMSNNQIKNLILDSKVYIDFGDHPGKDRMPRECASGGCITITGTQRCGINKKDIPIDEKFEYDETSDSYDYQKIGEFILEVLDDYQTYFERQKRYRNIIRKEKKTFIKEIQNMIFLLSENEV